MNMALRVFWMITSSLSFISVIYKLIKRQMNESNSILWFLVAFVMLIVGFFPGLINSLASVIKIDYPPTLLFLLSTIVLMLICFKSTVEISKMEKQITETAIVVSLLKEENALLRRMIEEKDRLNA